MLLVFFISFSVIFLSSIHVNCFAIWKGFCLCQPWSLSQFLFWICGFCHLTQHSTSWPVRSSILEHVVHLCCNAGKWEYGGCNPPQHDPTNMVAASSGSGMWHEAFSWLGLFVSKGCTLPFSPKFTWDNGRSVPDNCLDGNPGNAA